MVTAPAEIAVITPVLESILALVISDDTHIPPNTVEENVLVPPTQMD